MGASGWSPESYIVPAVNPSAPGQPEYVSSSASDITLYLPRSKDDGGLPILDYELEVDSGSDGYPDQSVTFSKIDAYNWATDQYEYTVDAVALGLTEGLLYRFRTRSKNRLDGFSDYSDTLMVGLGSLPSKPEAPQKSADESQSTETSIQIVWTALED